jgi:hypothetical protein
MPVTPLTESGWAEDWRRILAPRSSGMRRVSFTVVELGGQRDEFCSTKCQQYSKSSHCS